MQWITTFGPSASGASGWPFFNAMSRSDLKAEIFSVTVLANRNALRKSVTSSSYLKLSKREGMPNYAGPLRFRGLGS
jgi:hypothetical protein